MRMTSLGISMPAVKGSVLDSDPRSVCGYKQLGPIADDEAGLRRDAWCGSFSMNLRDSRWIFDMY
jgi:hypothetical protein